MSKPSFLTILRLMVCLFHFFYVQKDKVCVLSGLTTFVVVPLQLFCPHSFWVSQLLSKLSLKIQSLLIVIAASEKSKPWDFFSILDEQGRKEMYFFLFLSFKSDFVIFLLQRHLNTSLSIFTSCKTLDYGNLLGLENNKFVLILRCHSIKQVLGSMLWCIYHRKISDVRF